MQRVVAALLLGPATANNFVNPTTKMCLEPEEASKGASLSMEACKDDDSQNFGVFGGRIMSLATNEQLCIDIKAMCEDGGDVPGCQRQDITTLKEEAAIQLWTCRKDDEEGRSSNTYGNQKWDLLSNGYIKNELTGLCLVAHHDGEEKGRVHVHTCPGETDVEFVFDLETGDLAVQTNSAGNHACPEHGICASNPCKGKSCIEMLSEKTDIASALLNKDTGSNAPNAKTVHSKCQVAMQLLFRECEMCKAGSVECPNKLFSVMEVAAGHLSIGTSGTGVAVVTGLAAAAALAATLAIARSRRTEAQPHLLREQGEAVETSVGNTEA